MPLQAPIIRKTFKESDDRRDAGLTTPDDVIRYDNIVYGPDSIMQSLDVYRPKAAEGQVLPVIVSIHGGAWVYGDKELYQFYCMSLAQRGFAVVNFTYRLAPQSRFPACLEDTCSVFRWIGENAEQYGLDLKHLFAVGDSAGAHILSLYVCMQINPAYSGKFSFSAPKDLPLQAIALNCGAYELSRESDLALMEEVMPEGSLPGSLEQVSPLKFLCEGFPPAFIMTSTADFLQMQPVALCAKLFELKVPFELHHYGTAKNLLGHVFHLNMRSEDGKQCNDDECTFFRKFC